MLRVVRRKAGTLIPLEVAILEAGARGGEAFHGFELAKALADDAGSRSLVAHGTLYKALGRLTAAGLLEDEWEDADAALRAGRPRRRLYRLTGAGARALAERQRSSTGPAPLRTRPA